MVDHKFSADDLEVTLPVFVQPASEQECLLAMNTLSKLGVKVHRVNGEPLRQSGGKETKSQFSIMW